MRGGDQGVYGGIWVGQAGSTGVLGGGKVYRRDWGAGNVHGEDGGGGERMGAFTTMS